LEQGFGDAGEDGCVNFNRAAISIRTQDSGRCSTPCTVKDFKRSARSESKDAHGMMRSLGGEFDPGRGNELVWSEQKSGLHEAVIPQNPRC
jgi:hypothetical protein